MTGKAFENNVVIIDIRLLCDVESLHFEIIKDYVHKSLGQVIPTNCMTHLRGYGMRAGTEKFLESCGFSDSMLKSAVDSVVSEFEKYTTILKPKLMAYTLVQQLLSHKITIAAYSRYEESINEALEANILSLYQKIPMIFVDDLNRFVDTNILLEERNCTIITSEGLNDILSESLLKSN